MSDARPPRHEDFQELLGAYALDAVDADERAWLEDHLRECPRCRDEVEQHREVAALLAYPGAPAPADLWDRVSAALGPGEPSPNLAALYPLRARARRPWPLLAAAAAIVVVLGALGWQVHRQDDQISRLRAGLGGSGVAATARAAAADPRSALYVLTSSDGRIAVPGVLEPDGAGFLLRATGLPGLAGGRTYQLWGIIGPQRISLGLLGGAPDVVAFHVASPGITALAITAEQPGGAVQPTANPVVAGTVHAPA
jgi:Anti-sigma-K factor rskA/Putative zinc-finger